MTSIKTQIAVLSSFMEDPCYYKGASCFYRTLLDPVKKKAQGLPYMDDWSN